MSTLLAGVVGMETESETDLKRMTALEAEADKLHHTIIHELSQTFITPIDREDIYAISTGQERIIDSIHGLGTRFYLFSFVHVRFPAIKMVDNMHGIAEALGEMLKCLCAHKEPGGPVDVIQSLKENCEMLMGVGLSELLDSNVNSFDQVKQMMFWIQLYERIEQTIELFSELTDTMEQAVLKYA